MKVYNENLNLRDFEAWSGAKDTQAAIIEAGKDEDFEAFIEEMFPDGLTETRLNDILWFEDLREFEMKSK